MIELTQEQWAAVKRWIGQMRAVAHRHARNSSALANHPEASQKARDHYWRWAARVEGCEWLLSQIGGGATGLPFKGGA